MMTTTTIHEPVSAGVLLRENPVADLRRIDIAESEQEIVLSGIVTSYYLKQMAQETIRPVLAGRRLKNRLLVLPPK
ncbi:BON domain-containing protein [Zavarzinella formosa]|uniref:BON domain-containing protein n=1 Tax=Zavarzinella formosa TaxID=360055 RepID=UPI00030347EC|nr:BON domain-containing protein [Zavarzinella formosa]